MNGAVPFAALALLACAPNPASPPVRFGDLGITHASVLDVREGVVRRNQRIRVENGTIVAVAADDGSPAPGALDARGRLLTPGFIDAHFHLCNILGPPSCVAPREKPRALSMRPDSIAAYREVLAAEYLQYGVTSVRDVGANERYMPLLVAWMKRSPRAPDFFPVGADLITHADDHIPAPWQVQVADSADAARKAREYHDQGIRNIKLYWRLREPGFTGALTEATRLGMNVTGHVDFGVVKVSRALDLGLTNFEHMLGWIPEVLTPERVDSVFQVVGARLRTAREVYPGFYSLAVPMEWSLIGENDRTLLGLIDRLKAADASVTPTLHVFAQGGHLVDNPGPTPELRDAGMNSYRRSRTRESPAAAERRRELGGCCGDATLAGPAGFTACGLAAIGGERWVGGKCLATVGFPSISILVVWTC